MPTVGVYVRAFGHIPDLMGVARALITPHPMGRPLGAPDDAERQSTVVRAALALLESDHQTFVNAPEPWRTHR